MTPQQEGWVKIAITDRCGSRCRTCLQHTVRPQHTMPPELLRRVLAAVEPLRPRFFVNSVGDYLTLPNRDEYSGMLRDHLEACRAAGTWGDRRLTITTNCAWFGRPRIWASMVCCSLNAVTPEAFEEWLRMEVPFSLVVENIRYLATTLGCVEIHSLRHEGNPDPAETLLRLFGDTPARIRISEKVENQFATLPSCARVPCDYLNAIVIDPQGRVRLCSHDFYGENILGTIDDLPAAIAAREAWKERHHRGDFSGLCERCNYNTATPGPVYYIK